MKAIDALNQWGGNILVGGEIRQSSTSIALNVIDPATESGISQIAETTREEIDQAVDIAQQAQKTWWRKSALERGVFFNTSSALWPMAKTSSTYAKT